MSLFINKKKIEKKKQISLKKMKTENYYKLLMIISCTFVYKSLKNMNS